MTAIRATTPRLTEFIPHDPTENPKQAAFLCLDDVREAFYGGAAGGGKSDALLMAALQYVDEPGYAAIILRRNYKQLALPGALMQRSHDWLGHSRAKWHAGRKTWSFPSGATLTFGYLGPREEDRTQYESAEFQYIGVDEVTQFREEDYRFMFSRLRRLKGARVPVRMRSASNPGGRGGPWVKKRFVDPLTRLARVVFIPAFLWDNPHLDTEEYEQSLRELHPVMWRRLLHGDWDAMDPGEILQPRAWLNADDYLDAAPIGKMFRVRYWDLASSEPTSASPDPDYTAGARWSVQPNGTTVLEHVVRERYTPGKVERLIRNTAETDPRGTVVWIEREPGASGKSLIDHYRRNVLGPVNVRVRGDGAKEQPTGDKVTRATPMAGAMEAHRIKFVRGPWLEELFDEMEAFPEGEHDDQVDVCSGGWFAVRRPSVVRSATAAGRSA